MRRFSKAPVFCCFFALLCIFPNTNMQAETPNHIFLLDFNYTIIGFMNHGWGLGLKYEQKILNDMSVRSGFGHITFKTSYEDAWCATAGFTLFVNFYPFDKGLEGPYFGAGGGFDFLGYFASDSLPKNARNEIISFIPMIGWKQNVTKAFFVDAYLGYKLPISDRGTYDGAETYINKGFQYGIDILYMLPIKFPFFK
jgi:hypothetical protein